MSGFRSLLLALFLVSATSAARAAQVDTLAIPSAAMHKTYRAAVVLPASYAKNKKAHYPVLYLLHGAYGHFADWLKNTPDKLLVADLADQYNLIIVLPEGETFAFYLDSPVSPDSQFETYLTKEVLPKIDQTYRTVADCRGRVITGLSMGGHGVRYLSARHPGPVLRRRQHERRAGLDELQPHALPADTAQRAKLWAPILGSETDNPERFAANSIMSLDDLIHRNKLPLIIDCGIDDDLIDINREVHRRLLYNHTPHEYTERPGAHT